MANPGVRALRKLQLGAETTSGSSAAATTILRYATGTLEDTMMVITPKEDIGYLSGVDDKFIQMYGGKLALSVDPVTFEQICYILEMGVKTATPVQDGTGSGYVRTYEMATTAQPVIKTYTIEGGDDLVAGQERMNYSHVTDFDLSFKAGGTMSLTATIAGRQVALSNFTGSISLPTVDPVIGSKGKLYIDAVGGTLGSTQAANTIISGSLKVKTGLVAVPSMDGSLVFSFVKSTAPDVVLEIVFEHEGTSETERAAWRAKTARKMRLIFTGSNLTTSGTTGGYSAKTLMIDVAGRWEKFAALQDTNGNDTVAGTFRVGYDATAALFCNITDVNELPTLT